MTFLLGSIIAVLCVACGFVAGRWWALRRRDGARDSARVGQQVKRDGDSRPDGHVYRRIKDLGTGVDAVRETQRYVESDLKLAVQTGYRTEKQIELIREDISKVILMLKENQSREESPAYSSRRPVQVLPDAASGAPEVTLAERRARDQILPPNSPSDAMPRRFENREPEQIISEHFDRIDQGTHRDFHLMRAEFQRLLDDSVSRIEKESDALVFQCWDKRVIVRPFRNVQLNQQWVNSFDVKGPINVPVVRVVRPAVFRMREDGTREIDLKGEIHNGD
jgi:hypothetical protein